MKSVRSTTRERDTRAAQHRFFAAGLIAILATAVAAAQPAGKGLFIELNDGTEIFDIGQVAATTPGRPTGVQLHVCWSSIQTDANLWTAGNWAALASWLDAADAAGLKAILRIDMIGGATNGAESATTDPGQSAPAWLFTELNVASIGGQDLTGVVTEFPNPNKKFIARLPWYGDTVYQAAVADFAHELRSFLMAEGIYAETEPSRDGIVEMIRLGGWQANSNEPNFYVDYTDPQVSGFDEWKDAVKTHLIADLKAKGVAYELDGKPRLDDVSAYANASKDMIDDWIAAFDGTGIPLSTTVNLRLRECSADNEFLMYSLANGMVVLNPGLNEKDKTMTRTYFSDWKTLYGVKLGWGGVTGLPTNPLFDYTRVVAAYQGFGWDPMSTSLPECSLNEAWDEYRVATAPVAGASYAIFGVNLLNPGQNFAFECARELIQALAVP